MSKPTLSTKKTLLVSVAGVLLLCSAVTVILGYDTGGNNGYFGVVYQGILPENQEYVGGMADFVTFLPCSGSGQDTCSPNITCEDCDEYLHVGDIIQVAYYVGKDEEDYEDLLIKFSTPNYANYLVLDPASVV